CAGDGSSVAINAAAATRNAFRILLYYSWLVARASWLVDPATSNEKRETSVDNLTHSLFALTLSRTRLGSVGRGTTAALLLASNAPDVDIVTLAGGAASYLKWHRGPTHGPLGIVGLGLASAGIAWAIQRFLDRR